MVNSPSKKVEVDKGMFDYKLSALGATRDLKPYALEAGLSVVIVVLDPLFQSTLFPHLVEEG